MSCAVYSMVKAPWDFNFLATSSLGFKSIAADFTMPKSPCAANQVFTRVLINSYLLQLLWRIWMKNC
jgi:hypothetical protein